MSGTYSGNFVRTYAAPGDQVALKLNPAHTTTRGHGADGTDQYASTHQVPADQGSAFAGTDFPHDVTRGGGIVVDGTKRAGISDPAGQGGQHGSRAVRWAVGRFGRVPESQALARTADGHDEGGERSEVADKWAGYPVQDSSTVYGEDVREGQTIQSTANNTGSGPMAQLRGTGQNANPQNNPDRNGYVNGVRPGLVRMLTVERDRSLHRRRYDYQLQPQIQRGPVTTPVNRPPANPNGFGGPSLPDFLPDWTRQKDKIPGIWRDPGAVDASLVAAQPTSGYGTVIGSF